MSTKVINYPIGLDYLPNWGLTEGLREIFQNYIDYGKYTITCTDIPNTDNVLVNIQNGYQPIHLEFLRIGYSNKNSLSSIGHHGEGLKMAFLTFLRYGHGASITIRCPAYVITARVNDDEVLGKTFSLVCEENENLGDRGFQTTIVCPKDIYNNYVADIIDEKEYVYTCSYGSLLTPRTPTGKIYSGKLYVCRIKDLENSYDINPEHLPLDRDRCVPKEFDLDWAIGKILDSKAATTKVSTTPFSSRDYRYSSVIPPEEIKNVKKIYIGNNVEFVDKRTSQVITSYGIKDALKKNPKFVKEMAKDSKSKYASKLIVSKRKFLGTLLKDFRKRYCSSEEMREDIDVIIHKVNVNKLSKTK